MQRNARSTWRLWRSPLVLNVVQGAGLACALLGEGPVWRALAWACLLLPVAVAGFHACRRR